MPWQIQFLVYGFCNDSLSKSSRKHTYIILTPLNHTFIYLNWGLGVGYTLFFLFLFKNIDCGYPLEPSHRGGSNEYPQSIFLTEAVLTSTHNLCLEQNYENYQNFSSESFQFWVVKFSIYLKRCVFVMVTMSPLLKLSPKNRNFKMSKWFKIPKTAFYKLSCNCITRGPWWPWIAHLT